MSNKEKPICPLCNMDSDNCICHRWYLINTMSSFMEHIKELEDERDKLVGNFMSIKIKIQEFNNGHHPPEIFVRYIMGIAQNALEDK